MLVAAEIHHQKKVIHSVVGVAVWKMAVAVFQLFRYVVQCKRCVRTRYRVDWMRLEFVHIDSFNEI